MVDVSKLETWRRPGMRRRALGKGIVKGFADPGLHIAVAVQGNRRPEPEREQPKVV